MREHPDRFARDLRTLTARALDRRQALRALAGAALVPLLGCGGASDSACAAIPEETAGPYPGDGTNGANALELSGIVRRDITTSLGSGSATADGVALTIELTLVGSSTSCAALSGRAVYLWHCDREGQYSMYGSLTGESYLRGVQETGSDGRVTFESIFPGCYSGRWPHIHLEVYESLADATDGSNAVATTQMALPEAACKEVFAATGYSASVENLASTSLDGDNVFSDGAETQLATVTGSTSDGYTAKLTVAIDAG